VLLGVSTPSAASSAIAWVVPVLIGGALTVLSVERMGGLRSSGGPEVVPASEFWEFTRPRSASQALQIGLEKLDVILITALLGTGLAGIYGTVSRFATAGNFLIFSVAQAVSPNLRKTIAKPDWDQARLQLRHATSWMVLIAWPYFLVVALKSEALVGLFDQPELLEGTNALTVLGISMMASAAAGPVDLALLMLGRSKASLFGSALAFATDVILLLLLAKPFGLVGAALAWAASVAVQNGVATFLTHKHGNLFGPGRPSLFASIGAVVAVVPVAILTPQTFIGLLIIGAVAGPILLGWIYLNRDVFGLASLGRGRN
jgi:O-antigen/teichoic acid export membrane protein